MVPICEGDEPDPPNTSAFRPSKLLCFRFFVAKDQYQDSFEKHIPQPDWESIFWSVL